MSTSKLGGKCSYVYQNLDVPSDNACDLSNIAQSNLRLSLGGLRKPMMLGYSLAVIEMGLLLL